MPHTGPAPSGSRAGSARPGRRPRRSLSDDPNPVGRPRPDPVIEPHRFAASEAVANALKHAGPARIWLSAATEGAYLRVEVADDGAGGADPDGRGLRALGERPGGEGAPLRWV